MSNNLTPEEYQERNISIFYDYIMYKNKTLDEIGSPHGLSRERTRQIIHKLAYKARAYFLQGVVNTQHTTSLLELISEQADEINYLHGVLQENGVPFNQKEKQKPAVSIPITSIGFSVRVMTALKWQNICYLGQLTEYTEREFMRVPNLGRKSINEIKEALSQHGLCFKPIIEKDHQNDYRTNSRH
jgi:hypothetical protein